MKLANKIQFDLMRHVTRHGYDIVIPNFFYGNYEMDLFKVSSSGIIIEYEIKISRSDFFCDFKKNTGYDKKGAGKHDNLKNKNCSCNRFFFVVPEGLVSIDEVPDYAGLLYYTTHGFSLVKNAPMLAKKSVINYESLAKKLAFREQAIRAKSNYWKRSCELYQQQETAALS